MMNTKNNNPKKLVIKAFKEKPRLPSNYEAETMARLEGAVRAVSATKACLAPETCCFLESWS